MLQTSPVVIVRDPGDPVAAAMPVAWAESQLVEALAARSVPAMFWQTLEQVPTDAACVVLSGLAAPIALAALESNGLRAANVAEEVALLPAHQTG